MRTVTYLLNTFFIHLCIHAFHISIQVVPRYESSLAAFSNLQQLTI